MSCKNYLKHSIRLTYHNRNLHDTPSMVSSFKSKEQFFNKSGLASQHFSARNHHNLSTCLRCYRRILPDTMLMKQQNRGSCPCYVDEVLFDTFSCACCTRLRHYCKKAEFVNPMDRLQRYVGKLSSS